MRVKTQNLVEGLTGESKVCDYLQSLGYSILERNYKTKIGEIDIIALDKDRYVFIEVKTRSTAVKGYGREVINNEKIRKIRNSAVGYLKYLRVPNAKMRFDLIEIVGDELHHLQAIF